MTVIKIAFGFFMLLLLLQGAVAIDVNSLTQAEFDAYIYALQNTAPAQPQVTMTMDADLQRRFDLMQAELVDTKLAVTRMQEKFSILAQENRTEHEKTQANILTQSKAERASENEILKNDLKEHFTERTNPIRMSLPLIGIFFILTAVFLVWVARTYNFKGEK